MYNSTHHTVNLPDIGEGVVEGEVIEWLKNVNDPVKQDEPVVVVMTDKATVELPAPYPGTISRHYVKVGEIAIKDKPLYDIALAEGVTVTQKKGSDRHTAGTQQFKEASNAAPTKLDRPIVSSHQHNAGTATLATPPVRHLAKQLGIDLSQIAPTGAHGEVTLADIHTFQCQAGGNSSVSTTRARKRAAPVIQGFSSPPLQLDGDEVIPLIGIRNLMAERMVESKTLVPHFSYFDQCDATRLIKLRENLKAKGEEEHIKVTFMPFFIKALSMALTKYPEVNGSVDLTTNSLIIHKQHNIGIAIAGKLGLVVPVLKNVQNLKLEDVIRQYDLLKNKTAASKLENKDMQDGTISISNFGALENGGLYATPIINYPEMAILGVAKIKKQPAVKNDELVVRDLMNLSWSFDHRIIDGEMASKFSHEFVSIIENPSRLL